MSEPGNQEVYGPENLKQVNWGLDLDEGPQEAINYDLKLLQDAVGGHGIYPVEGMKYEVIVVPNREPLFFRPKSSDEIIAIPLGDELVFTSPGKSEKATVIVIGNSRSRGTVYRAFKVGEKDKVFRRVLSVDKEKAEEGLELRRQALQKLQSTDSSEFLEGSLLLDMSLKKVSEANFRETKDFEIMSPTLLQGHSIEIGPGNVSIIARGIVNNLLLVEVNSPFKVQVFTHEEIK